MSTVFENERRVRRHVATNTTIDPKDRLGLHLWSLVLGVSPEAIIDATRVVGVDVEDVRQEIDAHPDDYTD
ncbi:DUF3606 domain-containing protein [Luteibacter yeojuensis]|uniref:DUF3606 domain-containing protein n=1 Tax=Luteibacter yeojuensis TaxID=345309 RepID=UPI0012EEC1D5